MTKVTDEKLEKTPKHPMTQPKVSTKKTVKVPKKIVVVRKMIKPPKKVIRDKKKMLTKRVTVPDHQISRHPAKRRQIAIKHLQQKLRVSRRKGLKRVQVSKQYKK